MTPSLPLRLLALSLACAAVLSADNAVSIAVNPSAGQAPISPYIYGANWDLPGVTTLGSRRYGGNRLTAYNWETNASNAGSDYLYESDNYLVSSLPGAQQSIPGIALTNFHDASLAEGTPYTILTLQMAGYVSADEAGPVPKSQYAPSSRFYPVVNQTPGGVSSTTPNLTDSTVYMDQLLTFLVDKYGPASGPTGVKGYDLDNEPDLWSDTHPEVHPAQNTCNEELTKSVALATTIKSVDASAQVLGPVSYGSEGYFTFQGAPDWAAIQQQNPQYRWFLDYYLDGMSKASAAAGKRLLDVMDLHRYSDDAGTDGTSVTASPSTAASDQERVQSPRVLWDPTFKENSWVQQYYSRFLPWIPNIQQSIAAYYPGTKLSFSEYSYGGEDEISGGIAQADVLGIYGKYGVYNADAWPLQSNVSYLVPAFNLYLNYDGQGGKFGATSVHETDSDTVNTSAYASIDGSNNLHLIVINKNFTANADLNVLIPGPAQYGNGAVWAFDGSSASITQRASATVTNNQFTYTLPPLTAAHFIFPLAQSQTAAQGYLSNLSARGDTSPTLGIGDELAAGFITTGNASKNLLLRGIGPALQNFNITDYLTEPSLTLYSGQTQQFELTAGWNSNLASTFSALGAFSFTAGSLDQAAEQEFAPGRYSAYVGSQNSQDAIAMVEIWDADSNAPADRLINISASCSTGSGAANLVGGFVVRGQMPEEVLIRAVGPGLAPLGVTGTLAQPVLQVYDQSNTLIASNQGWQTNPTPGTSTVSAAIGAATANIMQSVGAFSLTSGDCALLLTLPPGQYTATVSSANGGTGVAMVEIYEVP